MDTLSQEAAPASLAASNQQERNRQGRGQRVRRLLHLVVGPRLQLRHQKVFNLFAAIALAGAIGWAVNFFVNLVPFINRGSRGPCRYHDEQLLMNAIMAFVYFLWCIVVRGLACVPRVYLRMAQVQVSTHGLCRACGIHMIFFGPLYLFGLASVLFLVQLAQVPQCDEKNPELYSHLKVFACYSISLGAYCLFVLLWHQRLLREALEFRELDNRRAPPDTLENLRTVVFDVALFGDEEGKSYPAECAICLAAWEPDEVIKVTPCDHAFHKECLGGWLRTERTCALCRHDVTKEPSRCPGVRQGASTLELSPSLGAGTTEPAAQTIGVEMDDVATETELRTQEEAAPVVTATADGLSDRGTPSVELTVNAGREDASDSVSVEAV